LLSHSTRLPASTATTFLLEAPPTMTLKPKRRKGKRGKCFQSTSWCQRCDISPFLPNDPKIFFKGERRHCKHWTATNRTQIAVCPCLPSCLPFSLFPFWHFLSHSTRLPASTATTSASDATHHDPKTQKVKRDKGKRVSKHFVVSEA
jgi:hypothetical protein